MLAICARADALQHAILLVGLENVVDILGADRDDAADRAGAVDVGDRAADDVDLPHELGVEVKLAVRVVAGDLIVLARAIDEYIDASKVLQAANIDRLPRIIQALLKADAGDVAHRLGHRGGAVSLHILLRDRGYGAERLDRLLFGLGGRHVDGVERFDLRGRGLLAALRLRICLSGRLRCGLGRGLLGLRAPQGQRRRDGERSDARGRAERQTTHNYPPACVRSWLAGRPSPGWLNAAHAAIPAEIAPS